MSVHDRIEGFVLTCHLLILAFGFFASHPDLVSLLYTDSLAVLIYHLQLYSLFDVISFTSFHSHLSC